MIRETTWTDQPAILTQCAKLASFMVGAQDRRVIVEISRDYHGNGYYVTAGNLFGSQTVLCASPEAVFTAIEFIHNGGTGTKGRPLPRGVMVVEG